MTTKSNRLLRYSMAAESNLRSTFESALNQHEETKFCSIVKAALQQIREEGHEKNFISCPLSESNAMEFANRLNASQIPTEILPGSEDKFSLFINLVEIWREMQAAPVSDLVEIS